jgi:DNA-directed RNA polymerase subunit E'/Rpb7
LKKKIKKKEKYKNNMKFVKSTIQLYVILNCDELGSDYLCLLKKKLKDEYEKKAFEKYGIIDEIIEIDSIHYEELMKIQPCIYFILNTIVSIYYPEKNDIITVSVHKILNYGIYIQKDSFRVLIPNVPSSYKIIKEKNDLVYVNDKNVIKANSEITIQLTEIRFEKQGFHCLANLIET